jgi:predicted metal-dependent hydrolase
VTKHSIQFGSREIKFALTHSKRKSLGITVTPDMHVLVKAPHGAPLKKIKEKVRKRAPWVLKQQNFFLAFYPRAAEKRYVTGESHLFLGRSFQLKYKKSNRKNVVRKGNFIVVECKTKNQVKPVLSKWYRERGKSVFAQTAEPLIRRFKKYGVEPKGLAIQAMTTRWGSCTPRGRVIFNIELIKAPKGCIEYVIVHELCHLVHRNHTQKFFELQAREMPDWKKWKEKLERIMA